MEITRRVDFSVSVTPDYYELCWPSESGRWRWTHAPGILVAAIAMITGALAFAAEPWATICTPASTLPMIASTLLLFVASDLMLKPRPPWARFRDRGIMQAGLLASGLMLMFCVLGSGAFAWPFLFPLFVLPMSLPIVLGLGIGIVSRVPMSIPVWRGLIVGCLVVALLLSASSMPMFQSHVACHWAGA